MHTMHSTPDAVLLLHNHRQRELQDEAAGVRTLRQGYASDSLLPDIPVSSRCLRVALVRMGAFLRDCRLRRPVSPRRAEAG